MPKKKIFWGWIILSFISFILITNNLQAEVTTTIPVLSNQTTTPILIKSKDEPSTPLVSVETKVKGNLKISTSKQAIFPDVNLNEVPDEGLVTNSQIEQVIAKDSRHNSPGWSVTATNTHFYNNESEQIAVNNLTIVPGDISGKDLTGISKGEGHVFQNTDDPALLMLALPGYGRGKFEQSERLELFIDVGIAPGDYSAVMIITIQ